MSTIYTISVKYANNAKVYFRDMAFKPRGFSGVLVDSSESIVPNSVRKRTSRESFVVENCPWTARYLRAATIAILIFTSPLRLIRLIRPNHLNISRLLRHIPDNNYRIRNIYYGNSRMLLDSRG